MSVPKSLGTPAGYIDTFIVRLGSTYHAFLKGSAYLEHATAASLTGPWTFKVPATGPVGAPESRARRWCSCRPGSWRIYFDQYSPSSHYWYAVSSDLNTFSAKKELPALSGTSRS